MASMASRTQVWLATAVLALGACAKGNVGDDDDDDGGTGGPDAPIGGPADAMVTTTPDAAPMMRTLALTTNDTIVSANSVSCNLDDGLGTQNHRDNRYFRVFNLPTLGINSAFAVSSVTIGVETAISGTGTQPATVVLHRLNGAVALANLTQIASQPVTIPDQDLQLFTANISGTAPAGSQLVVELFTPDGVTPGNNFFIGSNAAGETAPSYLVAPDCSVPDMMTTAALGFPSMHVVMKVTGTYNP
jgi:hypothetical protein